MTRDIRFDVAKGIAIVCVLAAHCAVPNLSLTGIDTITIRLLNLFGLLGVPVFLVVSGYFQRSTTESRSFVQFLNRKVVPLIVPWILGAAFTYTVINVPGRNGGFSLLDFLLCILGVGSIFYFVPVLIFLQILFFFVRTVSLALLLSVFMASLASIVATELFSWSFRYLNPVNWAFFYVLGRYFSDGNKFPWPLLMSSWGWIFDVAFLVSICYSFLAPANGWQAYFTLSSFVLEVVSLAAVFRYAGYTRMASTVLSQLGLASFTIYLLHLPFVAFANYLYAKFPLPFVGLKYAVVVVLCFVLVLTLRALTKKYPFWGRLVGLR